MASINITKRILPIVLIILMAFSIIVSSGDASFAASKPPVVKITSAEAVSSESVKLSWKKVKGVSGYQIYKVTKGGSKKIATVKGASKKNYTIKNLNDAEKHTFKIRAYKNYKKDGKKKAIYGNFSKKVSIVLLETGVASTQEEIEEILKWPRLTQLTIKTEDSKHLDIPEGDYSNVSLIVDAPNVHFDNHGVFKTITITQSLKDLWGEWAKGNSFIIDASDAHVLVCDYATVEEIKIIKQNSKLILNGNRSEVSKLMIDASVDCDISNYLSIIESIEINEKSNITIGGFMKSVPQITINARANGTTMNIGLPVNLSSYANSKLTLNYSSEGSTFIVNANNILLQITNNSETAVNITNTAGQIIQTVDVGMSSDSSTSNDPLDDDSPGGADSGISEGNGEDLLQYLDIQRYEKRPSSNEYESDWLYYIIENKYTETIYIEATYKVYDDNGYMSNSSCIAAGYGIKPGKKHIFSVSTARKEGREVLDISTSRKSSGISDDSADFVQVKHEKKDSFLSFELTNTSDKQISAVRLSVLLIGEDGYVISYSNKLANNIYGPGYSEIIDIMYPTQYGPNGREYIIPSEYMFCVD